MPELIRECIQRLLVLVHSVLILTCWEVVTVMECGIFRFHRRALGQLHHVSGLIKKEVTKVNRVRARRRLITPMDAARRRLITPTDAMKPVIWCSQIYGYLERGAAVFFTEGRAIVSSLGLLVLRLTTDVFCCRRKLTKVSGTVTILDGRKVHFATDVDVMYDDFGPFKSSSWTRWLRGMDGRCSFVKYSQSAARPMGVRSRWLVMSGFPREGPVPSSRREVFPMYNHGFLTNNFFYGN